MYRYLTTFLALGAAAAAVAGPGLDPGSRARLRSLRSGIMAVETTSGQSPRIMRTSVPGQTCSVGGFLRLNEGFTTADLEGEGVEITGSRGGILLVRINVADAERIASLPSVAMLRLERPVSRKMDRVRRMTGVDRLHAGEILDMKYSGKGVLCAAVDGGFDPNHLNFRNSGGSSRIQNFTYFRPIQGGGVATENYGPEYMPNIDTESSATFHGTHTLGIMAGGYRGNVRGARLAGDQSDPASLKAEIGEMANPYYGIAYGADIAVAAGVSSDYYIAMGIEEILNFAWQRQTELGRPYPVVINLSMGSNVGPHDGTGMLARYLDEVSDETYTDNVICVAAGNEGDIPISAHKTFLSDDDVMLTGMQSFNSDPEEYPNVLSGPVYIYSDSAEPFELQAVVYNKERGSVVFRAVADAVPEGTQVYYATSSDYVGYDTDVISPQLAQHFVGYLGVAGMLDTEESGRYYAVVDPMLWETPSNKGQYVVVIQVKGKKGQKIDMYADGMFFAFGDHGMAGAGVTGGTADGTVCDTATGRNTIVVGSYNSRDCWASLDGGIYSYDTFYGEEVSSFSSWGTLNDGRELPLVCAPGATVISSTNEYYLQDNGIGEDYLQARAESDGRSYSWHQCVGTSMSTPVVAGAVALWKEADPALRYSDVQEIIALTSRKDADVTADPAKRVQWGAGKFDAYAGMLEVLRRIGIDGVDGIRQDADAGYIVDAVEGGWHVMAPGAPLTRVALFTPAGVKVREVSSEGCETIFPSGGLGAGFYLLNVNGLFTKKVTVR